jgi:hypothetical protein
MKKSFYINSILGGISDTWGVGSEGSYHAGMAIDPDLAINLSSTTRTKTGAYITSPAYSKFSGTEIDGYPTWIITQPKTTNSYVYTSAGKLHSFTSGNAMRATDEAGTSFPITQTGGAGNGAFYYNNFLYLVEATDITQYGGLDQGASIAETENVWTGAKFGKAALTNVTYPSIRGVVMPNHVAHLHGDNAVYICDVLPTSGTTSYQGVIHKLKTKRTTIDGDTDDGSLYNAFDLPYGYFPTCIESIGTDLIIGAIQASSNAVNQGRAKLFFWDVIEDSHYLEIELNDPLVTALKNKNGRVHIFSGNASGGTTMNVYSSGSSLSEDPDDTVFLEDSTPPLAGAVDVQGDKIMWGGYIKYPETAACVWSLGSKNKRLPKKLHNIVRASSAGDNGSVTAIKASTEGATYANPRLIVGWGDDSAKGLDKLSSNGTQNGVFRSEMFYPGSSFVFTKVVIPLADSIDSGVVITPKLLTEDGSTTAQTLTAMNNTNYPTKRRIVYTHPELVASGTNNFLLELNFDGTVPVSVALPIEIEVDTLEDETA